ncbi:hypothetical protein LTR95_008723 [Oleoguttula sp. CCFEE 5521]
MLSSTYVLTVLGLLAASVSAGLTTTPATTGSTVTKSYCTTFLGSKSTSPVKTASVAITYTKTATKVTTVTPVSTKTPPAVTSTSTIVSLSTVYITASQITDTFTDTATVITTATTEAATVTISVVVTASTDFTVSSTSTVPAPAGFTPIQTSVGKNPPSKLRRDIMDAGAPGSGSLIARANAVRAAQMKSLCKNPKPQYPQKVACLVVVTIVVPKVVTSTAKTTKTVSGTASTSVVQSTSVIPITSTILPIDASTTISTSTTITVVTVTTPITTVISTTTATNTIYVPTATEYAQCGADNFIATDGFYVGNGAATDHLIGGVASAHDCCVLCAQQNGCEFSGYFGDSLSCFLEYNDQQTCSDTNQFGLVQDLNRYTASNGCVNAYLVS